MPTIENGTLVGQLIGRVSEALHNADADGDGYVDARERSRMPDDVRGLADAVADYYLQGGPLPIEGYLEAYGDFAARQVEDADANGDGRLQDREQQNLPGSIYSSLAALRAHSNRPSVPEDPEPPVQGAGVLGIDGVMGPEDVSLRTVVSRGLSKPTGLAFNPHDGSLWVLNRNDDSSVRVSSPTSRHPRSEKFRDDSDHFMNNPMGIAFSPRFNEFASIQETTNDYNRGGVGNMFMGPTLWPADDSYNGGHASHLDMVHHSPNSVGITAGTEYPDNREFWVFNGDSGAIDRYFFNEPHVHGGTDHADGLTVRYGGGLRRRPGVPGHLALDSAGGTLYIADTGNGRIAKMSTTASFDRARAIRGYHGETPLYRIDTPITSVTGRGAGLRSPSGLVLHDDRLVVSDYATGHIKVFTKDGDLVGDLDTGLGANSVTGLAVGPNGKLFIADAKNDRVVELTVP